ncbi:MAG: imidazole glycerol phosphate synthase subunit HisH [Candidatus Diapherotrites archaeon]|nr:imidazole glycerol phosphate synthase subunit HisH [Candidatus Diapherotrites archaeon]
MIAVIDFGAGNLRSVENALLKLGEKPLVTGSPEKVLEAEKVVFPGVGNFGQAAETLRKSGLDKAVKSFIAEGKPFLGICLGMQLLFEKSEESKESKGLGVLQGAVQKFPATVKVPQIGWNQLELRDGKRLFKGVADKSFAYFVHSYYAAPGDESVVAAETEYGLRYCSALQRGNVFACQFHPEKSGEIGLKILKNFVEMRD